MRTILKIVAVLALAIPAACALPDWMPGSGAISVKLSGEEEVPPVNVAGTGAGSFRIEADGAITGAVTTTGVEGTMAHIHQGARGVNGPVIVPLEKKGNTYSVPAGRKLSPAQLELLKAGNLYVNVHTNRNKGGEVRGQIIP